MNCGAAAARAPRKLPGWRGRHRLPAGTCRWDLPRRKPLQVAADAFCRLFRAWFHLSADPRVRRLTRGWILPSLWDWPQSIQHTCDLAKPKAPAGAPEYKPGVSPRTPGKACKAGQALNGRQTRVATAQCRRFAIVLVPAGSLDLPGPGLTRGAAEESQTVSVLNELRRSRGKGSPETSLVHGRHRLAAWTYRARNLREVQQKSRRQFLFSMNCGAAAARALRKLPRLSR